jgi:hypothetical protein
MTLPARASHRFRKAGAFYRSLRGLALAAAGLALIGGCARVPLSQLTQVPVERLRPADRLRQDKVAFSPLAEDRRIPPNSTIETIYEVSKPYSSATASKSCGFFCEAAGGLAGYFAPLIILPVAIVALPFVAAYEMAKPADEAAGSATAAIDASAKETERLALLSLQQDAEWLSEVALEGPFLASWDEAYIAALSQGLGKSPPPVNSVAELDGTRPAGRPRYATAESYFGAGISRMVLVGSVAGERTLIVCARSYLQSDSARARDFETCQSGPISLAQRQDGRQRLQAALVEKGKQLASLQAKALRGQATIAFSHVSLGGGVSFLEVGTVDESDFSPSGRLFVDLNSIEPAGKTDFAASLVVNFQTLPGTGVMSHAADVVVACAPGTVAFSRRRSYTEWYGVGKLAKAEPITRGISPGPSLDGAVQMICDIGPKLR